MSFDQEKHREWLERVHEHYENPGYSDFPYRWISPVTKKVIYHDGTGKTATGAIIPWVVYPQEYGNPFTHEHAIPKGGIGEGTILAVDSEGRLANGAIIYNIAYPPSDCETGVFPLNDSFGAGPAGSISKIGSVAIYSPTITGADVI
jgi:hypothetical protein